MFGTKQYYLEKVDNNTYTKKIYITQSENLVFDSFSIFDVNDNSIHYIYEKIYNNLPDQYGFLPFKDGEYGVLVSGESIMKLPKLKNITFSASSIKVPGYINAYLDIESENRNNLDIQIGVHQKDCKTNCGAPNGANLLRDENGKYYFKLEFDQYQPAGTYKVSSVIIKDSYDNQVTYATWTSEYEKVEPIGTYTFEIKNDTNSNVTTFNEALDIIDKINNANDDSIISIDTSKNSNINQNIFAAIKGTNKKISLESNGIRWIFNGKDIKTPKTIDISSKIILARDYKHEI